MTRWAMFWLFMIVYLLIETMLFLKGYDTLFWQHKTPAELEFQRMKLGLDKKERSHP